MSIRARFRLTFGAFALDADLDLPGRGVSALFGASGSGKTTLLRAIAGVEHAGSGYLDVNGEIWQDDAKGVFLPAHRRALGYVFQEANLFAHLSVRANLDYGRKRVAKTTTPVDREHVVDLLGIGALLDRLPARLSGGERQRVAIARALLASPKLLLLDEPLAALDHDRKQEILPYLERLHAELEIPMLYVSHAPDEVARLADHLVVLQGGRVAAAGPLAETLARLDLPIRLGEDAGVVLDGVIVERDVPWNLARVEFPGGSVWVRDGGDAIGRCVRVRILARDVSVARECVEGTSILNTLPATIAEIAGNAHPALALVRFDVGASPLVSRLTRRSVAALALRPGMRVWVQIKAAALIGSIA